jgi:hypothetical protein
MALDNLEDVLVHVKRYFGFLFQKETRVIFYEFPRAFDNFSVGLETPDFHVRFTRDRSTIRVQIGTQDALGCWTSDLWYDLINIVMLLTNNQFLITGYWEDRFNADAQLDHLGKVLKYYYTDIIELFKPDNFAEQKDNLNLISREMLNLIFEPRCNQELERLEEKAEAYWELISAST